MKKLIRPAIIFALTIFLALSCAMIAFSTKPPIPKGSTGAALLMQITPTPDVQQEDNSEVGSTDEIVVMGGVIAVIVLLPLLFQRKAWMKEDQP